MYNDSIMSIYPIYIDSTTSGAQLSIGTVNTSYVVIGAPTTSLKNTSSVINGVRLDSNKNLSNIIITYANSAITPINGTDNTVISDGLSFNSGSANTAVGSGTLIANTIASHNTAVGCNALKVNTASYNTAIGSSALQSNVIGQWNVAVGYLALPNSTGNSNVGVGDEVFTNISGTTSSYNVGIGTRSSIFYRSGSYNTVIGYSTNDNGAYTSGTANTCIGSGTNTGNHTYSTAIGYGATCTASNQIMLGTSSETVVIPGSITLSYTTLPTLTSSKIGYTAYRYFSGAVPMVSGTEYTSYSINLPAGVYIGQLTFSPAYSDSFTGSTTFTGFEWTVKSASASITSTSYSDAHSRTNMVYGVASTYPNITLGTLTFNLSANIDVYAALKPKFTITSGSGAASMSTNTASGTAGSIFTITRIG